MNELLNLMTKCKYLMVRFVLIMDMKHRQLAVALNIVIIKSNEQEIPKYGNISIEVV